MNALLDVTWPQKCDSGVLGAVTAQMSEPRRSPFVQTVDMAALMCVKEAPERKRFHYTSF
jgi:uncharacterized membrane protein (DUF4010 family)